MVPVVLLSAVATATVSGQSRPATPTEQAAIETAMVANLTAREDALTSLGGFVFDPLTYSRSGSSLAPAPAAGGSAARANLAKALKLAVLPDSLGDCAGAAQVLTCRARGHAGVLAFEEAILVGNSASVTLHRRDTVTSRAGHTGPMSWEYSLEKQDDKWQVTGVLVTRA